MNNYEDVLKLKLLRQKLYKYNDIVRGIDNCCLKERTIQSEMKNADFILKFLYAFAFITGLYSFIMVVQRLVVYLNFPGHELARTVIEKLNIVPYLDLIILFFCLPYFLFGIKIQKKRYFTMFKKFFDNKDEFKTLMSRYEKVFNDEKGYELLTIELTRPEILDKIIETMNSNQELSIPETIRIIGIKP